MEPRTNQNSSVTHRFRNADSSLQEDDDGYFASWTPVLQIENDHQLPHVELLGLAAHCVSPALARSLSILQAVPDEEPVPHPAFPPPGAATSLRHCRVLPEAFHRDALLYLLLPGGRLSTALCSNLHILQLFHSKCISSGHPNDSSARPNCVSSIAVFKIEKYKSKK